MKKLLKLNPQYPISIGLILMGVGGVFFDVTSDIGLGITLFSSNYNGRRSYNRFHSNKEKIKKPLKLTESFFNISTRNCIHVDYGGAIGTVVAVSPD